MYNNNGVACHDRIVQFVNDHYMIAVQILGACIGLLAFAIVFNTIYLCALFKMKAQIKNIFNNRLKERGVPRNVNPQAMQQAKALYLLQSLDVSDLHHLVREFHRIDADGNGTLDRRELAIFFKKGLCHDITKKELDDLFSAMDVNGDGVISLEEFLVAVHPEKATSALALADEHRQRKRSQKPGGDQFVSLNTPSSPTNGRRVVNEQEIRQRLASTFQDSGVFDSELTREAVVSAGARGGAAAPVLPRQEAHTSWQPPASHLARLRAFYEKYQPSKISTAEETLEKFAGREHELWAALVQKYGPEPTGPPARAAGSPSGDYGPLLTYPSGSQQPPTTSAV